MDRAFVAQALEQHQGKADGTEGQRVAAATASAVDARRRAAAGAGVAHPSTLSAAAMCVSFCLCWLRRHATRLSGSGAGEAVRVCRSVLRRAGDVVRRVPVPVPVSVEGDRGGSTVR